MASLTEQFIILKQAAQFTLDRKNRRVCPLTGKTPTQNRCFGQLDRRLLIPPESGICEKFCIPKFDDEKICRYGGLSDAPIDPDVPKPQSI